MNLDRFPEPVTVEQIDCAYFHVPLPEVVVDAKHGDHSHFDLVTATVRLSDGSEGTGYTYTGGRGGSAIFALLRDDLAPYLVDREVTDIRATWDDLNRYIHYVGRGGIATFAISALDIALWDALCRGQGQPLWQWLGGEAKPVRTYAGLIDLHYAFDDHMDRIRRTLDAGHNAIKLKVGRPDLAEDLRRVEATREILGPDRLLMVDANMTWSAETAIEASRAFEAFDVFWFEEPVDPDDFIAFQRVGETSAIPLAMGENLHLVPEFEKAFATGRLAFPQPDASNIGGITGWLQVAELARKHGRPVSTHGMQELHVMLLAAMPHAGYLEHHTFPIDHYTRHPLVVTDGYVQPPPDPGCVTFDWDKLRPYRIETSGHGKHGAV